MAEEPQRKRRIFKRTTLAVAAWLILCGIWVIVREPPEISRSRDVRLGMTYDEVFAVMGPSAADHEWCLRYGESTANVVAVANKVRRSLKTDYWLPEESRWPVRIHFSFDRRVIRIERGDDVEEASKQ